MIECKTYRWFGHWTGDPQPYRTKEEIEAWKEKCPVKRLREYLIDNKILTEEEISKMEAQSQKEVEEAAQFALNSPEPDHSKVLEDVFFEN